MTSRLHAICALLAALATLTCFAASGLAGPSCSMAMTAAASAENSGCEHCAPEARDACVAQCLVVEARGEIALDARAIFDLELSPEVERTIAGLAAEPCTPPPRLNVG